MQTNPTQNPPSFRTIGELTAEFVLESAERAILKTRKDPLTPEQRRQLTAQAGGK